VELKVPITIADELSEDVVESTGFLDLASGEIRRVVYTDYDVEAEGLPRERDDYEFTCGTLSNNGKDVEFRIDVNSVTGEYSVSANELLEIKVRAAQLFAGLTGRDLAHSAIGARPPAPPPAPAAPPGPPRGRSRR
jgi:hypothetical protein